MRLYELVKAIGYLSGICLAAPDPDLILKRQCAQMGSAPPDSQASPLYRAFRSDLGVKNILARHLRHSFPVREYPDHISLK